MILKLFESKREWSAGSLSNVLSPAVFVFRTHLSITHCCEGECAKYFFFFLWSSQQPGLWRWRDLWYAWGNACSCIKLHTLYSFILNGSKLVWPNNIYEHSCKYCIWKNISIIKKKKKKKLRIFKIRDSGPLSVLLKLRTLY